MPTIVNPKINLVSSEVIPSVKVAPDNVVILEINNLLSGWPTYVIDYTPEKPGPVKIILKLKDVQKYVWIDDEDSENEEGAATAYQKKHSAAAVTVDLIGSTQQMSSTAKAVNIDATPVHLYGILKDIEPTKKGIFDGDEYPTWPPPRPRAFREVSTNRSADGFSAFKTVPAPIQAVCTTNNDTV